MTRLEGVEARPEAFYSKALDPDDLADLLGRAADLSLDVEIACTRITLRRVLSALRAGPDGNTPLTPHEFARLSGLAFQGANTVAHLLRDRRAIQGEASDGISSAIACALDELATEWGIEL